MSSQDHCSGSPSGGSAVFRTTRLSVRRWRPADEPDLLTLYSIDRVVQWVDDGQALSPSEAARWMEVTFSNYQKHGYGMFAIEEERGAKTIGFGGLVHPNGQLVAEIKYAFFPEVWGQGFATEFVQGLLKWAQFAHSMIHAIATVASENLASQRVLVKSGFRQCEARIESDGSRTEVFEVHLRTRQSSHS
ncbi:MAG: GNAT family N-acetyltransferase [Pseudomonadota bacterium]